MTAIAKTTRQAIDSPPFQSKPAAPIISAPCTPPAAPTVPKKAPKARSGAAGFTLIEMMIAVSVAGVLSSVAYPSFVGQVQKVRRTDAVVAMMQVQWAQERWRSNNSAYGSLAEIGTNAISPAGYYTLQVSGSSASGYEVLATAVGTQARDTNCAQMKLSMLGANTVYASGPDAGVGNAAAANRQCWSL
jgi:type IV pilus assembly protein PilE